MVKPESRRSKGALWLIVAVSLVCFTGISVLVIVGYTVPWTGFNEQIGPNPQQYQPAKTLWNWLELLGTLAIPVVVGVIGTWYTAQQAKIQHRETAENQREAVLQAYLTRMAELLLNNCLDKPTDQVHAVAQVQTLRALSHLDSLRKRSVLEFVYQAGLIQKGAPILDISGADLRGADLRGITLRDIRLRSALISHAMLQRADLRGSDL